MILKKILPKIRFSQRQDFNLWQYECGVKNMNGMLKKTDEKILVENSPQMYMGILQ